MTMVVLVMMSILVTGFLVSMRTEMVAAHSAEDIQRTKMVSQGAVSHAINLLRANIPEPAPIRDTVATARMDHWIVNPGQLTVFRGAGSPEEIPLHTGAPDSDPRGEPAYQAFSVDLNRPLPGEIDQNDEPVPPITYALDQTGMPDTSVDRPEMWMKWVNVLRDPMMPADEDNEIIGRYAFWMDDECSRLNYNVANGKPAEGDSEHYGRQFHDMLDSGFITPGLRMGSEATKYRDDEQAGNSLRTWSLGSPRTVNLDILFGNTASQKARLRRDDLLDDTWLRGFNRYPEGLLEYIDIDSDDDDFSAEIDWLRAQRFNLTFYSRAPEFNPFGRSRLFTSRLPLSLEAGPMYQLPFVVGPTQPRPSDNNLHMHTLMGSYGFTDVIDTDGDGTNDAASGNLVNRGQLKMLLDYMRRDDWPGYEGTSFVDKYGEKEAYQIALNMLALARNWTTGYNQSNLREFSKNWFHRTTSVGYHAVSGEMDGEVPERFYWRFPDQDGAFPGGLQGSGHEQANGETLLIPQMPGPYCTEVRLKFRGEETPRSTPQRPRYALAVTAEAELWSPRFTPPVVAWNFPVKIDYLELEVDGPTTQSFVFGRPGPISEYPDGTSREKNFRNWNNGRTLGQLTMMAPYETETSDIILISEGSRVHYNSDDAINYGGNTKLESLADITSETRYIVPQVNDRIFPDIDSVNWRHFDTRQESTLNIRTLRVRFGLTGAVTNTNNANGWSWSNRPRQMIPLGEYAEDTLSLIDQGGDEEFVSVDLESGNDVVLSWEIDDPQLSWDKNQWQLSTQGGTPGYTRAGRVGDTSKYTYVPRGPNRFQVRGNSWYNVRRSDEYNSYSATPSKGYWSIIRTGIQNLIPNKTMDLGTGEQSNSLPDTLLLELMGSIYPMQHDQWKIEATLPDRFSTVSFMNSTAGAINLNSRIYPDDSPYFEADLFERRKPLEAVFKELRSDSDVERLVDGIIDEQKSGDPFLYVGELARVPGYEEGGTEWEKESLLRNMIGCLTTQSNTFGLWGVAQTVKKSPRNGKFAIFEKGDEVVGEKRFFAIIERYVWPGKDGRPGNAHANSSGRFDRVAKQEAPIRNDNPGWSDPDDDTTGTFSQLPGSPPQRRTGQRGITLDKNGTYPEYDGPQQVGMDSATKTVLGDVEWSRSSLEDAYNPPQAVIKYRVAYFKYLDQ